MSGLARGDSEWNQEQVHQVAVCHHPLQLSPPRPQRHGGGGRHTLELSLTH